MFFCRFLYSSCCCGAWTCDDAGSIDLSAGSMDFNAGRLAAAVHIIEWAHAPQAQAAAKAALQRMEEAGAPLRWPSHSSCTQHAVMRRLNSSTHSPFKYNLCWWGGRFTQAWAVV